MTGPLHGSPPLQSVGVEMGPARPRAYFLFTFGLALCTAVILLGLTLESKALPLGMTFALAVLMIVSENRDRIFGDETSISSSIVVAIASVVAFHESAPLLGPLVCSICAGLYVPHIKNRSISKLVINACVIGLSALVGAIAFDVLSPSGDIGLPVAIGLGLIAVIGYWLTNSILLAGALALLRGAPFWSTNIGLVRSEIQLVPFAVAGAGVGLIFLNEGLWLGCAALVGLLVLVEVLWLSPLGRAPGQFHLSRFAILRGSWIGGAGLLAYAAAEEWISAIAGLLAFALLVLTTITLVLIRVHHRLGSWELGLAVGAVLADSWLIATFALGGALAGATEVWIGVLVVLTGCGLAFASGVIRRRRNRAEELPSDDELLVVAAVELAMLDAAESAPRPR